MTPLDTLLARLDELEEKATKGPWDARIRPLGGEVVTTAGGSSVCYLNDRDAKNQPKVGDDPDAALIAELRNAYPALRAALRERTAALERIAEDGYDVHGDLQEECCSCASFAARRALGREK